MNRDTLAPLLDAHPSNVSNRLNEVMKKMTVIATVPMTMALISGNYGMNFTHMPELKWVYGHSFALGIMIGAAILILWMFRRNKWI